MKTELELKDYTDDELKWHEYLKGIATRMLQSNVRTLSIEVTPDKNFSYSCEVFPEV